MRNKRTSNGEDLPLDIKFKKYKLLFSYHFRGFWKKIISTLPFILFIFSFILFLSILIPNFVQHKYPILGEWPIVLELDGSVLIKTNDSNYSRFIGVGEATIEIGGYKSVTDQEGRFHIKFVTKSPDNIPVIIQWSSKSVIKRVSFEFNHFKKTETFTLND